MRAFLFPILCLCTTAMAQDTLQSPRWQFAGYVKDLQSLTWQQHMTGLVTGNLIHNRLNVKWIASPRVTAAAELRNRLYWGEDIALIPDFSSRLRNQNEAVDLSVNWLDEPRMVLNTNIDRLWAAYQADRWSLRLGRQRINWGIGTTWNPNDLFNTFNFLDFDYEERPGADAMRLQYLTGEMSHLELALSVAEEASQGTGAVRYFTNVKNYDIQFIGGWFHEQPTLGLGWSGSIRETGFKGEMQYYFARKESAGQLNLSIEADHVFEDGWYASAGALLNNRGVTGFPALWDVSTLDLNPRNLMPTKWNTVLTVSKEITPLIAVNTTVIYTPRTDLVMLLPTLTFSLTENVDFHLVWQSFYGHRKSGFGDLSHRAFLRIKWNF